MTAPQPSLGVTPVGDLTDLGPVEAARVLPAELRARLKTSYALRRVPEDQIATLLPLPEPPHPGDIVVGTIEFIGRNGNLELVGGRRSTLHLGDAVALAFGNRYATRQFEGYARASGDMCDLLSMGGLCGQVVSKHANAIDPTRVRLLGAAGDAAGRPLRLRDFALDPAPRGSSFPRVVAVCGSSMDAGKTHTVMSLVVGLGRAGRRVAGIKLTGTATGRDTWATVDAGACVVLDFIDGGFPSTYLCPITDLLDLHELLLAHAALRGAELAVIEIADGVLQRETAALLRAPRFRDTVSAWVYATGDPLAAVGGVSLLRDLAIEPLAVSGVVSMSPLGMREVEASTGLPCVPAAELQAGRLNEQILREDRA